MANSFQLSSSQTAIALVLPDALASDVNSFRAKHDKAFRKWPAHINILYPFVSVSRLEHALPKLQSALSHDFQGPLNVTCDAINVFKHSKSATLFLQPDQASTERLRLLRRVLTAALGCAEADGTHDGEYRPHLTLGQSDTSERAMAALSEQALSLTGLQWSSAALTVLQRDGPGRSMSVVSTLRVGQSARPFAASTSLMSDWQPCFSFTDSNGWQSASCQVKQSQTRTSVLVTSINIMEEDFAPPLTQRLPTIVRALDRLQSAIADMPRVLCLQEVSTKTLPFILQDEYVQRLYPYSSHSSSSLLPSKRNLIVFASNPFLHYQLHFAERHKSVLIIQFLDSKISVVNVHLTSGFSPELIETKRRQMSKLSAFLERRKLLRHVVLAGDFNIPTSSLTLQSAVERKLVSAEDAYKAQTEIISADWEDAFDVADLPIRDSDAVPAGEEGATFDRLENTLAAMNARSMDHRPQRYDRILARADGALKAQRYFMAKLRSPDGQYASDHSGISAVFSYDDSLIASNEADAFTLPARRTTAVDGVKATVQKIDVILDEHDIQGLIRDELPSEDDEKLRKTAMDALAACLVHDPAAELELKPIGSYGNGTWLRSSDIDVLASGKILASQFFPQALGRLRNQGHAAYFIDAKIQRLEAHILGVNFDIQYRKRDSILVQDVKAYNTLRDMEYILATVPCIESFRTAQRFIMVVLKRRGLCGAKFGYLGGIHVTLMLNSLLKQVEAQDLAPASIVRMFFNHYATHDWSQPIVDPTLSSANSSKVDGHSAACIRSLFTPATRLNVAESCSVFSVRQIANEFAAIDRSLSAGNWRDSVRSVTDSVSNFFNKADLFIHARLEFWSLKTASAETVRGIVGLVESRLLHVPTRLSSDHADEIDVQIWPARFRSSDAADQIGHYLIGITGRRLEGQEERVSLDTKKLGNLASSLASLIPRYEPWSPSVASIQCAVLTKRKVLEQALVLGDRDWTQLAIPDTALPPSSAPDTPSQSKKASDALLTTSAHPDPSVSPSSTPLRPVQDVLARLTHDTDSYDAADFLIGYDDRFAGTMEMPLAAWKRDATHDEFIPLHRIVWVRRRDDAPGAVGNEAADGAVAVVSARAGAGEKVWDRHTRLDRVFGSGRASA